MMQIKISVLHPQSWALDLIEGKLGSDHFVCMVCVAAGRYGLKGMLVLMVIRERLVQASVR